MRARRQPLHPLGRSEGTKPAHPPDADRFNKDGSACRSRSSSPRASREDLTGMRSVGARTLLLVEGRRLTKSRSTADRAEIKVLKEGSLASTQSPERAAWPTLKSALKPGHDATKSPAVQGVRQFPSRRRNSRAIPPSHSQSVVRRPFRGRRFFPNISFSSFSFCGPPQTKPNRLLGEKRRGLGVPSTRLLRVQCFWLASNTTSKTLGPPVRER